MKNINKDWQTITDFRHNCIGLTEMTYEVCHIPPGKTCIFKSVHPPNSSGEFCAYDMFVKAPNRDDFENWRQYWDVYTEEYIKQNCKPAEEFKVRYNPKKIAKLEKIIDTIQIGDYVNFGSSRRYKWRKVLNLDFDSFKAFSQCSKTPNDDGLVLHSSENSLLTTKEIYRDGKKIF